MFRKRMLNSTFLLLYLFISLFSLSNSQRDDGYTCAQYRHLKDRSSYAQTCVVYGLVKYLGPGEYFWELVGTWKVWSDCRDCGSPFHNFTDESRDLIVEKGHLFSSSNQGSNSKEEDNDDPTTLNHCCIYGLPPYYDGPDYLAEAINPKTGDICEGEKYQFHIMGQWYTSHFYAPLSWCFWQTYIVTENK